MANCYIAPLVNHGLRTSQGYILLTKNWPGGYVINIYANNMEAQERRLGAWFYLSWNSLWFEHNMKNQYPWLSARLQ